MKDLMKRIWKPGFGLLLLAAPVWVACDDDDDKDNGLWGDANITQAATTRYPGAQITEIERTPQGYEIQMWINNGEAEMYIDGNYQCPQIPYKASGNSRQCTSRLRRG